MHSTDNINDGYVGSGKRLWYSIHKHGLENHICNILEFYDSREKLVIQEKDLINADLLKDPQCMNLAIGGSGSWAHCNQPGNWKGKSNFDWELGQKAYNQKLNSNPEFKKYCAELSRQKLLKCREIGGKIGRLKALSEESNQKRKNTFQKINHQSGEKNSQFGTCWIFDPLENKAIKVKKDTLHSWIDKGCRLGRK